MSKAQPVPDGDIPPEIEHKKDGMSAEEWMRIIIAPSDDSWREGLTDPQTLREPIQRKPFIQNSPVYEQEPPEVTAGRILRRQQAEQAKYQRSVEESRIQSERAAATKDAQVRQIQSALASIVTSAKFPQIFGSDLKEALTPYLNSRNQRWEVVAYEERWDRELLSTPYLVPDSAQVWSIIRDLENDQSYVSASKAYEKNSYAYTRTQMGAVGASLLLLLMQQQANGVVQSWNDWRMWLSAHQSNDLVSEALQSLVRRVSVSAVDKKSALRSFMLGRYWDHLRSELIASILNEAMSGWLRHPILEIRNGVMGVFQDPLQVVTATDRTGRFPTFRNDARERSIYAAIEGSDGMPIKAWISSVLASEDVVVSASSGPGVRLLIDRIRELNAKGSL